MTYGRVEANAEAASGRLPPAGTAWQRARRKFLGIFPGAFRDPTYLSWERDYKWSAHKEWEAQLGEPHLRRLLRQRHYAQVASAAVRIESGRSLLFSFEKMALRDAVRGEEGARTFTRGLAALLHGTEPLADRFENWCEAVASLPRKQTRVLTWPLVTVFAFIACPRQHIFLKPLAMKRAARQLGYDLQYDARPNWRTYEQFLHMAESVRRGLAELRPRDMIDIQSFFWVLGSDEYN